MENKKSFKIVFLVVKDFATVLWQKTIEKWKDIFYFLFFSFPQFLEFVWRMEQKMCANLPKMSEGVAPPSPCSTSTWRRRGVRGSSTRGAAATPTSSRIWRNVTRLANIIWYVTMTNLFTEMLIFLCFCNILMLWKLMLIVFRIW